MSLQNETEEFPVGLFRLIMFDNNAIYSMYCTHGVSKAVYCLDVSKRVYWMKVQYNNFLNCLLS